MPTLFVMDEERKKRRKKSVQDCRKRKKKEEEEVRAKIEKLKKENKEIELGNKAKKSEIDFYQKAMTMLVKNKASEDAAAKDEKKAENVTDLNEMIIKDKDNEGQSKQKMAIQDIYKAGGSKSEAETASYWTK